MLLGIAVLLVAVFTTVALILLSPAGPLAPPHGKGCDCGECARYLADKQLREMKRKGRGW